MSSDHYRVTVLSKKKNRIVLRVATGFAGGRNDYACTRSFALSVLADARRRFNETEQKDLSKGVRFRQAKVKTALEKEQAKWPSRWQSSEAFYTEKVGDYVDKTTVGARYNQTRTDTFSAREHDLLGTLENENLSVTELEDALCAHFHSIELAVEMTYARWLAGIEEGWIFGTTAYDAFGYTA